MAIASSLFSPKSLMDRFRSPVFIASALSLGAHGVFFAAMPMLSASEDLQDQEESVPVVALSAEESQRLPDAVRPQNNSNAFFANNPLVSQDGESLLPVPGIPPYGDLNGLDSSFNDPLATAPPPLWDNPVNIFQDSLPAIPGETSVIFPETNTFDTFSDDSFGDDPFEFELDGALAVDDSATFDNSSAFDDALAFNDSATFDDDLAFDDSTAFDDTSELPILEEFDDPDLTLPEDQPLLGSDNELPAPELEPPSVGTTLENAFENEPAPLEPVTPEQLAGDEPLDSESNSPEPPPQPANTIASNDPAVQQASQADQQLLQEGYTNNGSGGADQGQVAADLGQLVSEQAIALQPAQSLVAQYPDPNLQCPADALPALFTLVNAADGSIIEPTLAQSTQYPALDTAATAEAAAFAEGLTEPGIYQLSVQFEDEAGLCATPEVLS